MKVFVTGGSGLVGSNTIDFLLERGDEVVAIDNFLTGRRDNLAAHADNAHLKLIEGSIADVEMTRAAIEEFKPDVIVHTAASYADPDEWERDALVNAMGSATIARAAKDFGVGRIVYFQTALCYGLHPQQQPIPLDHPINPGNSSYAISKTAGEYYIQHSGVDYVTFRLANVVGGRGVSGPLPIFFQRLSQGKKCFVTPARRDFVLAQDLARNVVRAVSGDGNGTYHFSSGKDVAIKKLYDLVVEAMQLNEYPEPDLRELSEDDAPTILLDPTRTFADFGNIEFTPIEEIVRSTIEHYRTHGVEGGYTHLKELGNKTAAN